MKVPTWERFKRSAFDDEYRIELQGGELRLMREGSDWFMGISIRHEVLPPTQSAADAKQAAVELARELLREVAEDLKP